MPVKKGLISYVFVMTLTVPWLALADVAGFQDPWISQAEQVGENVRLVIDRGEAGGEISIYRESPNSSKVVLQKNKFDSLEKLEPDAGDLPSWVYPDYLVIDECVPPGEAKYTMFWHTTSSCHAEFTVTVQVENVGQECSETVSPPPCIEEESDANGCTVVPSQTEGALTIFLLLLGAATLMVRHRT